MQRRVFRGFLVAAAVCLGFVFAAHAAHAATFNLELTTSRGCDETGDHPVFQIGEPITVSFRVGSLTEASAQVTLFDELANGTVAVFSFGQIATNQMRSFNAFVGPPPGSERLVLQAQKGLTKTQLSCTFTVASGTPAPTRTRTPSRTPTPIGSVTTTPAGSLSAEIHTNRGCIETGDNPVYAIGDPIVVSFQLDSATLANAKAAILDYASGVLIKIFSFGIVPTNTNLFLNGFVGPPGGIKTLRLRGEALGVPKAYADCSFNATGGPIFPTRTPHPTRTATFTRSPTPTKTPTKTTVPTPCVGACTQPDSVSIADVVIVAEIAAGTLPLSVCPSADANGDQMVTLDEVLLTVNNAIHGCGP